jgi:hypothetical protein
VAYVRTVKTSSGATAVQIVWSSRRGSRSIEHLGSARDEAQLAVLKAAADERLAAGQAELDLGVACRPGSAPLPITSSRAAHLWDALGCGYDVLGFDKAASGHDVFRQLVLARILEPTSKAESLRVLDEAGVAAASYPTLNRRLPVFAKASFRQALSAACSARAPSAALRLPRLRGVDGPAGGLRSHVEHERQRGRHATLERTAWLDWAVTVRGGLFPSASGRRVTGVRIGLGAWARAAIATTLPAPTAAIDRMIFEVSMSFPPLAATCCRRPPGSCHAPRPIPSPICSRQVE